MIRIPASNRLLKELWIHASANREAYRRVYYNKGVMVSYSTMSRSTMTYRLDEVTKSMLPVPMVFELKLDREEPFFQQCEGDAVKMICLIRKLFSCESKVMRTFLNPSEVNKTTINAVLGSTYRTRLRPVTQTKHYTSLIMTDGFFWFNGERSDYMLLRNPVQVRCQASSQQG